MNAAIINLIYLNIINHGLAALSTPRCRQMYRQVKCTDITLAAAIMHRIEANHCTQIFTVMLWLATFIFLN